MKNFVVEVLDVNHEKEVISLFNKLGVKTCLKGNSNRTDNNPYRYYGFINNKFDNYRLDSINRCKTEIITTEQLRKMVEQQQQQFNPKTGDRVLFSHNGENYIDRIFAFKTKDTFYYISSWNEEAFLNGEDFRVYPCKHIKPLVKEEIVELTLKDISEGKGIGVPSHLIRIKE